MRRARLHRGMHPGQNHSPILAKVRSVDFSWVPVGNIETATVIRIIIAIECLTTHNPVGVLGWSFARCT
jgi:hypothetical protein